MKQYTFVYVIIIFCMISQHAVANNESNQTQTSYYVSVLVGELQPSNKFIATDFDKTECKFKNGANMSVASGYEKDKLRIEGELSYQQMDFEVWTISDNTGLTSNGKGDQQQYSLFANIYYEPVPFWKLAPYVGGGFGVVWKSISVKDVHNLNKINDDTQAYDIGLFNTSGPTDKFNDTDGTRAYQFMAGLSFDISKSISINTEYRVVETKEPSFLFGGFSNNKLSTISMGISYRY